MTYEVNVISDYKDHLYGAYTSVAPRRVIIHDGYKHAPEQNKISLKFHGNGVPKFYLPYIQHKKEMKPQGFCHSFYNNGKIKKSILMNGRNTENAMIAFTENGKMTDFFISGRLDDNDVIDQWQDSIEKARFLAKEIVQKFDSNINRHSKNICAGDIIKI